MESWQDRLAALKDSMGPELEPEIVEHEPNDLKRKDTLNIVFERKGRGGKLATIIEGFTISQDELEALASEMKRSLGTGGSARGGEILIQGDRREAVRNFLRAKGYKTKG